MGRSDSRELTTAEQEREDNTVHETAYVLTVGPREAESMAMTLREFAPQGVTGYPEQALNGTSKYDAAVAYATYYAPTADGGQRGPYVDGHRLESAQRSSAIVWSLGLQGDGISSRSDQQAAIRAQVGAIEARKTEINRNYGPARGLARIAFRAFGGLRYYELRSKNNWVGLSERAQRRVEEKAA